MTIEAHPANPPARCLVLMDSGPERLVTLTSTNEEAVVLTGRLARLRSNPLDRFLDSLAHLVTRHEA